jgi:hypothetical protein
VTWSNFVNDAFMTITTRLNSMVDKIAKSCTPEIGEIRCRNLERELENVNMDLFLDVQKWLRIHGKVLVSKALLLKRVFCSEL